MGDTKRLWQGGNKVVNADTPEDDTTNDLLPFFASLHQHGMEYFYKEILSDSEEWMSSKLT